MSVVRLLVNPHPEPCPCRLARVTDVTLRRMIALRRSEIPSDQLAAAGVPPLATLAAELRRRETAPMAIAS